MFAIRVPYVPMSLLTTNRHNLDREPAVLATVHLGIIPG